MFAWGVARHTGAVQGHQMKDYPRGPPRYGRSPCKRCADHPQDGRAVRVLFAQRPAWVDDGDVADPEAPGTLELDDVWPVSRDLSP